MSWLALVAGCDRARPEPLRASLSPVCQAGARFNPKTAGRIRGQVIWQGDVAEVAPIRFRANQQPGSPALPRQVFANPNRPVVDGATRGVAGVVVYLRGIGPEEGKPWDHPPVTVEMRGRAYHVLQGQADAGVGFVRRGESLTMVSRDNGFYSLHAGGAAYFTLAFPDPCQPLTRELPERGLVELTSGSAAYWMRAYLFVDDHPYYARTDAQGYFTLDQVPPGRYELVCWLPSWEVERRERDPETGQPARVFFRRPVEIARPLEVQPGQTCVRDFFVSARVFTDR
jgi:hypothetical protein